MRIDSGRVESGRRGPGDLDWPHYDYEARSSTIPVQFEPAFEGTPTVVVGLSKVEWKQPGHRMVAAKAQGMTPEGFDLLIESGRNTKLETVADFWLAYSVAG